MQRFDDNKNIRAYKDSEVIKRLLKFARPVLWYFIISIILTALVVAVDLLPAYLQGELIGILQSADISNDDKMGMAVKILVFYLVIILLVALLNYGNSMMLQKAGQKVILDVRRKVFVKFGE